VASISSRRTAAGVNAAILLVLSASSSCASATSTRRGRPCCAA
jgi:hypothetical protein